MVSNPAQLVSFNKLKDQLKLGSVNTVKSYVDYMENSWLIFTLNVYAYSVKRQQIAPKKVYCIDTGLASTVGFSFPPNTGKLLENLVFLALRRQTQDIFYLSTPGGYEVDFYLPGQQLLIQVAQHLDHADTREREIRALQDAIKILPISNALILADAPENTFNLGDMSVEVQSLAEWLAAY